MFIREQQEKRLQVARLLYRPRGRRDRASRGVCRFEHLPEPKMNNITRPGVGTSLPVVQAKAPGSWKTPAGQGAHRGEGNGEEGGGGGREDGEAQPRTSC